MRSIILFIAFILAANSSYGEYLVKGATISEVSNTIGNSQDFYIIVKGGTGICANSQIRFPYPTATNLEKSFDRAFSIALTGYVSGQTIHVYDYDESSTGCNGAESIRLTK